MSVFTDEEREELIREEMLYGSSYEGAAIIVEIAEDILENILNGKILNDDGEFVDIN